MPPLARRLGLSLIALLLTVAIVEADVPRIRVGDRLPDVAGETLNGHEVTLPASAAGTPALLLMGFTYDARTPVEQWSAWCRKTLGAGVACYEMPMLGGMAKLASPFIKSGMRKSTPEALRDHVITVTSKTGDWKDRVGHTDATDDDAFLILIDRGGIVRWVAHGDVSPERTAALQRELAALAAR
jgi:hypothetical protein